MLGNIFSDNGTGTDTLPELPVSFLLAPQKQLRIHELHEDTRQSWRYYSHHITRFPQDLRAHAQRLFLSLDSNMNEMLPGAMQDLFIALGNSGSALRKTMLELTKSKLNGNDVSDFESWLSSGQRPSYQVRLGSVLDNGILNKTELLVIPSQEEAEQISYGSVIEEAYAFLEYGQVEEAQQLLENALKENTQDAEIAQELLNIYQYTRDKAALDSATELLRGAGLSLSDDWILVQQESQDW